MDISKYNTTLIDASYDTRTFSSMGYVFVNEKWYKKESIHTRTETPQATHIFDCSTTLHIKKADHIKVKINGFNSHVQVIKDNYTRIILKMLEYYGLNKGSLRRILLIQ